jgi:hypothetical protein
MRAKQKSHLRAASFAPNRLPLIQQLFGCRSVLQASSLSCTRMDLPGNSGRLFASLKQGGLMDERHRRKITAEFKRAAARQIANKRRTIWQVA